MRSLFQFSACASFLFLLLLGGYHAAPDLVEATGLDLMNAPHWYRALEASCRRSDELNGKLDEIFARTETKNNIARDLIAGRLTVLQAAARFRDLPGVGRDTWEIAVASESGASHEERLCRYAIGWVEYLYKQEAETLSAEAKGVLARLDQELNDHLFTHDGIVELP